MVLVTYRHGLRGEWVADRSGSRGTSTEASSVSIGPRARYPLRTADRPGIARAPPPQARKPVVAVCVRIRAWAPLSAEGFPRTVKRAGVVAKLGIKAHAHMLRHAYGFKLANDGIDTRALQAYFGHSNIQNTARYTELASGPFKNFWRD